MEMRWLIAVVGLYLLGLLRVVVTQTRETTEAIEAEITRQREAVREKRRRNAPPLVDEKKLQQHDRVIISFIVPDEGKLMFEYYFMSFSLKHSV